MNFNDALLNILDLGVMVLVAGGLFLLLLVGVFLFGGPRRG